MGTSEFCSSRDSEHEFRKIRASSCPTLILCAHIFFVPQTVNNNTLTDHAEEGLLVRTRQGSLPIQEGVPVPSLPEKDARLQVRTQHEEHAVLLEEGVPVQDALPPQKVRRAQDPCCPEEALAQQEVDMCPMTQCTHPQSPSKTSILTHFGVLQQPLTTRHS